MSDNVPITPGSGVSITTEQITADSSEAQIIKLAVSNTGDRTLIPATSSNGLTADVTRVQGNVNVQPVSGQVFPVSDNSGSLTVDDGGASFTVDAPAGTPVAVRLSDGSAFISGLPVSGEVTADQGSPAAVASGWPVKITDGTNTAGLTTVGGTAYAVKVDVIQSVGGGSEQTDNTAFTEGTSEVTVLGGEYNDSPSGPASGQAAAARITAKRALHANLRDSSGNELGISSAPVRTDPTGTTTQPVSQTGSPWGTNQTQINGNAVATVANGAAKVGIADGSGNAYSATNPQVTTRQGQGETRVTNSVALSASETAQAIWTPASGKKFYIRKIILVVTTAGPLKIFDGTDAAANRVFDSGTPNWPTGVFTLEFDEPWASSTANNVLEYTSGSGLAAVITTHGFEA